MDDEKWFETFGTTSPELVKSRHEAELAAKDAEIAYWKAELDKVDPGEQLPHRHRRRNYSARGEGYTQGFGYFLNDGTFVAQDNTKLFSLKK